MSEDARPKVVVGALILNNKKEILLVKSFKWFGHFQIPGGHVEEGETIEKAFKREIFEEVGLKIKILNFLNLQESIFSPHYYKRRHFIFLDYLCQAIDDEKVKLDNKELQEFIWIKPEQALKLQTDPFIRKAIRDFLKHDK